MRLIKTNKAQSFKNWVTQHNPELDWDFNNTKKLEQQLSSTIGESGDIDVQTLFHLFFLNGETELSVEQNESFLNKDY